MKQNFMNTVKMPKLRSNVFDLTHDVKTSFNMGNLIPTLCMECSPGDKVTLGCESIVRFAPLIAPVMHRFDFTMHYFFVPLRILWEDFENYITNTPDEITELLPAFPYVEPSAVYVNLPLPDYLDIPTHPGTGVATRLSALPFAAYQKIYNEYYRDQNLIAAVTDEVVSGSNNSALDDLFVLRKRAWEKDIFTSALPYAQKGEAVDLPLGVVELDPNLELTDRQLLRNTDGTLSAADSLDILPGGELGSDNVVDEPKVLDPNGTLVVGATTVNDLRTAVRLQMWLEKAARGGTRYAEWLRVMFDVKSSDARLNRPEYITGVKTPIMISEVLNNTGTEELPQGNMSGHAVGVTSGKYGRYFCEEHGYIMGIMSVLPKTAYQQGIPKHFLKINHPTEFFFSDFAHLGEQPIQNQELYAWQGATDDDTFGYTPKYAEYKYLPNRVSGDFRTTLNHWTAARIFTAPPVLNESFVSANPTERIFAVIDEGVDKLYCQILHKIKAVRRMPKFGTPTF